MSNEPTTTKSEISRGFLRRLLQANQEKYDASSYVRMLEVDLAVARAEVAALRSQLQAFETSTIWRLSRPLRLVMSALHRMGRPAHEQAAQSIPAPGITQNRYDAWIEESEALCRAALISAASCCPPPLTERLGLVILAKAGSDSVLLRLLSLCPKSYTVLILDQDAGLSLGVVDHERVRHLPVTVEFDPVDAVQIALECLHSDMLCFLDAGDQLAPDALTIVANTLAQRRADVLFADEDWLDAAGRRVNPFFKPGWDPELQRGRDMVGPFVFLRTALVRAAEPLHGPAWLYDLTNQVAAATLPARIHHIPAVLCHRTISSQDYTSAIGLAAAAQLKRDGLIARVEPCLGASGWSRVIYAVPEPAPLVSIIVPTRNRADLLRRCAEGVLKATDYSPLELLIVDNGSEEPDALALLDSLAQDVRVRVLRRPGAFNWSALNNAAADQAAGSIIVLMNNDIAVLAADWLTVLVSHAIQPRVGAVGAKLLYPDGRIQHAGLSTDRNGVPRHLFRYLDENSPGPFGLMSLARKVWGVTGACLATRRDVFFEVGGLNETFPVAYNDVEFCLRLAAYKYDIIWTPWCRLEHREMATRPSDQTDSRLKQLLAELERLRRDWGSFILHDPFVNPNLLVIDEQLYFGIPRQLDPAEARFYER